MFADFILSPEGQKLLNDLDRNPSSKKQDTLLTKYKHAMVDPIKWTDNSARVGKLWRELFMGARVRVGRGHTLKLKTRAQSSAPDRA